MWKPSVYWNKSWRGTRRCLHKGGVSQAEDCFLERPDLGALLRDSLVFFYTGLQLRCLTDALSSLGRSQLACALCFAMVHLRAWKQPETSTYHKCGAESAQEWMWWLSSFSHGCSRSSSPNPPCLSLLHLCRSCPAFLPHHFLCFTDFFEISR